MSARDEKYLQAIAIVFRKVAGVLRQYFSDEVADKILRIIVRDVIRDILETACIFLTKEVDCRTFDMRIFNIKLEDLKYDTFEELLEKELQDCVREGICSESYIEEARREWEQVVKELAPYLQFIRACLKLGKWEIC